MSVAGARQARVPRVLLRLQRSSPLTTILCLALVAAGLLLLVDSAFGQGDTGVCDSRTHFKPEGGTCTALTLCSGFQVESAAPTATSDRTCEASPTADCLFTSPFFLRFNTPAAIFHATLDGERTVLRSNELGITISFDDSSQMWVGRIFGNPVMEIPGTADLLPSNLPDDDFHLRVRNPRSAADPFIDTSATLQCYVPCSPDTDPCCFRRFTTEPPREAVRECLDSITIDGNRMRSTLRTLRSGIINFYGFERIAADSTASQASLHPDLADCGFNIHPSRVDLSQWVDEQIEALDRAADERGDGNGEPSEVELANYNVPARRFHRDIAEHFFQLQDAHTLYYAPAWGFIEANLRVRLVKNPDDNSITVLYTPQDQPTLGRQEMILTHINGDPALEWLTQQSEQTVSGYRSQGVRFNNFVSTLAESHIFGTFSVQDLLQPELDAGLTLTLRHPTTDAESTEQISLGSVLVQDVRNFIRPAMQAYYDGAFVVANIATGALPRMPEPEPEPTRRRRRSKSARRRRSELGGSDDDGDEQDTPWYYENLDPWEDIDEFVDEAELEIEGAGAPEELEDLESKEQGGRMQLEQRFHELYASLEQADPDGELADMVREELEDAFHPQSQHEHTARHRRAVPDLPIANGTFVAATAIDSFGFCIHSHLESAGVEAMVLKVTTFAPNSQNLEALWLDLRRVIQRCVDYGQANGVDRLLLDMSANGGGYVDLMYNMLAVFKGASDMPSLCDPTLFRVSPLLQRILRDIGRGTRGIVGPDAAHRFASVAELKATWEKAIDEFRASTIALAGIQITNEDVIAFVTEELSTLRNVEEAADLVFSVLRSRQFLIPDVQSTFLDSSSGLTDVFLRRGDAILRSLRELHWGDGPANYTRLNVGFGCLPIGFDAVETESLHSAIHRQFPQVALLADGTCGSACSFFSTNLLFSPNVTVFSFGGTPSANADAVPMDIASFGGANVYEWDGIWRSLGLSRDIAELLDAFTQETISVKHEDIVFNFPTPASGRFAFHMVLNRHLGEDALPREWYNIPAHKQLDIWEPVISWMDNLHGLGRIYALILQDDWDAARASPQFYGAHCTEPRAHEFGITTTLPVTTIPSTTPFSISTPRGSSGDSDPHFTQSYKFIVGVSVGGFVVAIVLIAFAYQHRQRKNKRTKTISELEHSLMQYRPLQNDSDL